MQPQGSTGIKIATGKENDKGNNNDNKSTYNAIAKVANLGNAGFGVGGSRRAESSYKLTAAGVDGSRN